MSICLVKSFTRNEDNPSLLTEYEHSPSGYFRLLQSGCTTFISDSCMSYYMAIIILPKQGLKLEVFILCNVINYFMLVVLCLFVDGYFFLIVKKQLCIHSFSPYRFFHSFIHSLPFRSSGGTKIPRCRCKHICC